MKRLKVALLLFSDLDSHIALEELPEGFLSDHNLQTIIAFIGIENYENAKVLISQALRMEEAKGPTVNASLRHRLNRRRLYPISLWQEVPTTKKDMRQHGLFNTSTCPVISYIISLADL